jgi:uncharacterized protein YjbJ (UPF0337 family)
VTGFERETGRERAGKEELGEAETSLKGKKEGKRQSAKCKVQKAKGNRQKVGRGWVAF